MAKVRDGSGKVRVCNLGDGGGWEYGGGSGDENRGEKRGILACGSGSVGNRGANREDGAVQDGRMW